MTRTAGMRSTGQVLEQTGCRIACTLFVAAAALFALTTLCAIINFGLRQPMFDQWREYETLIGLPFPQDVIQLVNGHRPIVPNLIRVADIHWFAARQILQLTIGTLSAYLTVLVLAVAILRERDRPALVRCIGVMLAVLGLLWMGNARRLLHGTESLHGHLPTLTTMIACLCAYRAPLRRSVGWLWAACLCCAIATFSFGVGLASFPAVMLLMLLQRMPLRWLWLPAGVMAACFVLYVFLLPGGQGVRNQIDLDPLDLLRLNAQWIASPWVNGWLELPAHPERLPVPAGRHWYTRIAFGSAQFLLHASGASIGTLAALVGGAGILAFVACVWLAFRRRQPMGLAQSLFVGGGAYALASAALTVVARVPAFHEMPGQIFAARYMTWPCLFWSCLALLFLWHAGRNRAVTVGSTVLFALMPVVLYATQNTQTIWGSLVYRRAQQTAAALRSGVYDAANFPGESLGKAAELREIRLLRDHRLAMFHDLAWQRVGSQWTGSLAPPEGITVETRWLGAVADKDSAETAGHFEGWVVSGIARAQKFGQLAVLDDSGTIVGLAEYSYVSPVTQPLMLRLPRKRGFDGYVTAYDPAGTLTLAVLDLDANTGIRLATFKPSRSATIHAQ